MEIRAARPREWPALRELRLRALADAPDAFGDTYERAAAEPDDSWRRWIEHGWGSGPQVTLIAEEEGGWHAMVVGVLLDAEPGAAQLYAMWVDPARRGEGLGRALVEAVVAWALEGGARRLRLGVTKTNAVATALYRSCGFLPTGEQERELREGSELVCGVMERSLEPERNGTAAS